MKIYIPHNHYKVNVPKELFILVRPFYDGVKWLDDEKVKSRWHLDNQFVIVSNLVECDIVLLPFSINYYFLNDKKNDLKLLQQQCQQFNKKAFGLIGDDFGIAYPEFLNIIYFRMGGFRSQLSKQNQGFPVALSDHFQRIFHHDHPIPADKNPKPMIGFCGHATLSQSKRFKELLKCVKENTQRFLKNPRRKDWEPLFASAYERAKLLKSFQESILVKTNFIFRNHYRAGAKTESQRNKTILEYYNNIAESDYVLCVRGGGNFSVRLYETLMMGKIPVFVNTDCLLPFESKIDWKKHVVWVEWKDRKNIVQKVSDFHNQLTNEEFLELQISNRKLWKETLSVKGLLELVKNDI